jgi:hypothetical protein
MFRNASKVLVGLAVGLVITEVVFAARDDFAFPHVNFYQHDDKLGVRLQPNASERLVVASNPVSLSTTNSVGFRGDEWRAPSADEIVVVGDSQVFGLGVNDDETFSAQLHKQTGVVVINGGVPTYGPQEYLDTAREIIAKRQSKRVVVTINVANDFFEVGRPNIKRHATWDGWAVRKENAPFLDPLWFPFRDWFMSRSHAVFAARRLLLGRDGDLEGPRQRFDPGSPSEGGWGELLSLSQRQRDMLTQPQPADNRSAMLGTQSEQIQKARSEVERIVEERTYGQSGALRDLELERVANGRVGDIVYSPNLEAARGIALTASMIEAAAQERKRIIAATQRELDAKLADANNSRAVLQQLRWEMAAVKNSVVIPQIDQLVTMLSALQDEGIEVTLLLLPLDVQVSSSEWAKYHEEPRPMKESLVLHHQLLSAAKAAGLRTVDAFDALAAAEPGAFLDGDLHMTPKGHAAVATTLAKALREPLPPRAQPLRLEGVGAIPTPAEWDEAREVIVTGSTKLGCETKLVHNWLRVVCRAQGSREAPIAVDDVSGMIDIIVASTGRYGTLSVLVPVPDNTKGSLRFRWGRSVQLLTINTTGPWQAAFAVDSVVQGPAAPKADVRYQQCLRMLLANDDAISGDVSDDCMRTYMEDDNNLAACARVLACAEGHPDARPRCDANEVLAGALPRCLPICTATEPCDDRSKTCGALQGLLVCR